VESTTTDITHGYPPDDILAWGQQQQQQ